MNLGTPKHKKLERENFAREVADYLSHGGKIQQLPCSLDLHKAERPAHKDERLESITFMPSGEDHHAHRKSQAADDKHRARVLALFNAGWKLRAISKELGYVMKGCSRIIEAAGMNPSANRNRLTDDEMSELRELHSAGATDKDIARITGMHLGRVRRFLEEIRSRP